MADQGTRQKKYKTVNINEDVVTALNKKVKIDTTIHNKIRSLLGLELVVGRTSKYNLSTMKVNERKTFGFEFTNPSSLYNSIRNYEKTTPLRWRLNGSVDGYVVTRYK